MYKMEASLVFYLNIYLVIIYDEGLSCDEAMKQASFSPEYSRIFPASSWSFCVHMIFHIPFKWELCANVYIE